MKLCADKGNHWCWSALGQIYFKNKHYDLAYPLLHKASEKYDGNHDFFLGCMYTGEGKPLDYDKAAFYFAKSAKRGDAAAAYNVSVAYSNKAATIEQGRKTRDTFINHYAWLKIALRLDLEIKLSNFNDRDSKLTDLERLKRKLIQEGWLKEADILADEIYSGFDKIENGEDDFNSTITVLFIAGIYHMVM